MALLSYLQIFVSMFTSVILFFFPHLLTYKTFVLIIAVVSAIAIVYNILRGRANIINLLLTLVACGLIIVPYYLTASDYIAPNDKYNSFLLVLTGQMMPSVLCAVVMAGLPEAQLTFKKLVPVVGLIFTVIAFIAAFFPSGATTGGFVSNDNNLNYQNTSYLAAYATGFNLYYLILFKDIDWFGFFRTKTMFYINTVSVLINLLSIFIAGGRGGLVLFAVQLLFAAFLIIKTKKNIISAKRVLLALAGVYLLIIGAVNFASDYGGKTNGFSRIMATVIEHDTNGRNELRHKAFEILDESPAIGHGIGSVFYTVGEYTHNCITDALVETGYFGCTTFIIFILVIFIRCNRLINYNPDNSVWMILFLDGFIMSLFSGYYLASLPVYWIAAFVIFYKPSSSDCSELAIS